MIIIEVNYKKEGIFENLIKKIISKNNLDKVKILEVDNIFFLKEKIYKNEQKLNVQEVISMDYLVIVVLLKILKRVNI